MYVCTYVCIKNMYVLYVYSNVLTKIVYVDSMYNVLYICMFILNVRSCECMYVRIYTEWTCVCAVCAVHKWH